MLIKLCYRIPSRSVLSLLVMVLIPFVLLAQQNVTGLVTDINNAPISGVSVTVKGSPEVGTSTDVYGRYSLSVPANAILMFSFIGFDNLEKAVEGNNQLNITLNKNEEYLDEVIVVGYGTQKKVTLTGAVSDIQGTEMRATKNENPQNMLAGRIAGVRVWQKSAEPGSYKANLIFVGWGHRW